MIRHVPDRYNAYPHIGELLPDRDVFPDFDLAATFIFAWAVSLRETGWHGYVVMLVFIFFLRMGLSISGGKGCWKQASGVRQQERQRKSKVPQYRVVRKF